MPRTRQRKVIQATEDIQIFVQENVEEDSMTETNSGFPIKEAADLDEKSVKVAETIITKLGNCEKYLRIIVNLDKQISQLTDRKRMLNCVQYDGIDPIEVSQASGQQNHPGSALKSANLLFPLKSAADMFDINERCAADDELRKQVIFFFKSRKQLAKSNFRSAMRSFATDACLMECNWRVDHLNTKRKNVDQLDLMRYMYDCWFPNKPYTSFVLSMKDYFRRVHNRFAKRKQLDNAKNDEIHE